MGEIVTEWVEITKLSPSKGDIWSPYETSVSGGEAGSTSSFYGERTCVILDSMVSSMKSQYDPIIGGKGQWPGSSGMFAPWQSRYQITGMPERAGCRRLTLIYTDPSPVQLLVPGRAVLLVRVLGTVEKPYETEIPHATDPLSKWVIENTGGNVTVTDAAVTIRTVGTRASVPEIWSRVGKINSHSFPNIGNAPAKTMMFHGADISGELVDRTWWQYDYQFHYKPLIQDADGNWVTAHKRSKTKTRYTKHSIVTTAQQADDDGNLTDYGTRPRFVTAWKQVGDAVSDPTDEPEATTFTDLDGQLSWY
jgi:hypothetical protein